jgi:hypothetical protein
LALKKAAGCLPQLVPMPSRAAPPLPALLPALLLLQLCAFAGGRSLPDIRSHDLVGWQGERSVERRRAADVGTDDGAASPVFLSWSPRIILVERFLSEDEAAHIIDLARCVAALSTRLHGRPIDFALHTPAHRARASSRPARRPARTHASWPARRARL